MENILSTLFDYTFFLSLRLSILSSLRDMFPFFCKCLLTSFAYWIVSFSLISRTSLLFPVSYLLILLMAIHQKTFLFKKNKHFYFLCKGDSENLYKGGRGVAEQGASSAAVSPEAAHCACCFPQQDRQESRQGLPSLRCAHPSQCAQFAETDLSSTTSSLGMLESGRGAEVEENCLC